MHHIDAGIVVMEDGEAGFAYIQEVDARRAPAPDIFILDLSLPRRNGPELLERIKLSDACSGVSVMIASSSHNPKDRATAEARGADRYFVKPSNFDEFMKIGEMVQDLLRRRFT